MRGVVVVVVALGVVAPVLGWPGMKGGSPRDVGRTIGPDCTIEAHTHTDQTCPNMPQPSPPPHSLPPTRDHVWPEAFVVDWKMYFVMNETETPPYAPEPHSAFNVTTGRTWFTTSPGNGLRNMRESYYEYCIPVFGDPTSVMGSRNDYRCDFINVGAENTSFVVMHNDRPEGVPECCIIGRPFHPPPTNFHHNMPVRWAAHVPVNATHTQLVDWGAVFDKDAGIFNYGFNANTSHPFAFYMKGVPWLAAWMWQPFGNFQQVEPPKSVWDIPQACRDATACPGW